MKHKIENSEDSPPIPKQCCNGRKQREQGGLPSSITQSVINPLPEAKFRNWKHVIMIAQSNFLSDEFSNSNNDQKKKRNTLELVFYISWGFYSILQLIFYCGLQKYQSVTDENKNKTGPSLQTLKIIANSKTVECENWACFLKCVSSCSSSLLIWEMQTKNILRHHFPPIGKDQKVFG